jgi:hypothetical protein
VSDQEWVVIAEARRPSDARSDALSWFTDAGFKIDSQPGRAGFGIEGVGDDQIKVDSLFNGTWWRISVLRAALGAAAPPA